LLFSTITPGGGGCIDFNAPSFALPWPLTFTINSTYAGGTGRFAGATGSSVGSGVGAVLIEDLRGNSFGWFSNSFAGTITAPNLPSGGGD
jgi:hypothetical protein